ncbi:MAG: hypothetical protein ACQEXK_12890 [Bacillota bacterium]
MEREYTNVMEEIVVTWVQVLMKVWNTKHFVRAGNVKMTSSHYH